MKPRDKVRIAHRSPWRGSVGSILGTVTEVDPKHGLGWVHFPGFGYAQGWSMDEFDVVEVAPEVDPELAELGCCDDG